LLALDLWQLAEIAIPPEEIKGVINQPTMPARSQLCLKLREVGAALVDDHHLAIDDGFARDSESACDLGEAFGPVQPIAGEDLLASAVEMHLNAIAVVLDFMEPQVAFRRFGLQGCKLGLIKAGISIRFGT
jgi:hypothetical protein